MLTLTANGAVSQVAQLKMEKQELQQRNRILESSLTVNTHHEERLHCNEVRFCGTSGPTDAAPLTFT